MRYRQKNIYKFIKTIRMYKYKNNYMTKIQNKLALEDYDTIYI